MEPFRGAGRPEDQDSVDEVDALAWWLRMAAWSVMVEGFEGADGQSARCEVGRNLKGPGPASLFENCAG